MTKNVNLADAASQLAELIELVRGGDEIIFVEDEKPLARLVAPQESARNGTPNGTSEDGPIRQGSPRVLGLNQGAVMWMSDDFDAPLPDAFWLGEE